MHVYTHLYDLICTYAGMFCGFVFWWLVVRVLKPLCDLARTDLYSCIHGILEAPPPPPPPPPRPPNPQAPTFQDLMASVKGSLKEPFEGFKGSLTVGGGGSTLPKTVEV